MTYPIFDIPVDSPVSDEPMGTKRKFWLIREDGSRWLFKYARVNDGVATGEDWAEKVACELARLLGIPVAPVELATCGGQRGMVSFDVTRRHINRESKTTTDPLLQSFWEPIGALVHGNEFLSDIDPAYPKERVYRVSEHTVDRVVGLLESTVFLPPIELDSAEPIETAADAFVGYLLLDALIGNTDRHHENWGVIVSPEEGNRLCPSYDHASSLGRNMSDEELKDRLTTRDGNRSVQGYAARAKSAFYDQPNDQKPLSPIDAFRKAALLRPKAAVYWKIHSLTFYKRSWKEIIDQVPDSIMSEPAKEFADRMLQANFEELLKGQANTP